MMRTAWMRRTALAAAVVALSACTALDPLWSSPASYTDAQRNPLISSSRSAIAQLAQSAALHDLGDAPVLVATVVNVNHLGRSAPLGRTLSEMYASQLARAGLNVKEMKLRGEVFVQEGTGELLLSREIRDIASLHSASVVLVGTYSQAKDHIYISLKLVRMSDSRIVGSYDYALPNERDVQRLVAGN